MRFTVLIIVSLTSIALVILFLQLNQTNSIVAPIEEKTIDCPTWPNHLQVLDDWSDDFNANNPRATEEERRQAWYETLDANNCERELPRCPTDAASFNAYWNNWSADYLMYHPNVDVDTQMDAWNAVMAENQCDEQWIDPLDDLIDTYRNNNEVQPHSS